MAIPKKVDTRIRTATRRLRRIIEEAKNRDVNEADTRNIVQTILSEVFGWDRYFEVTAEHAIRGTYVDLAVRIDDTIAFLVEVKAIGSELKPGHLRQAVNYAANEGIDWTVLTNAVVWQVHRVSIAKKVSHELVFELDFLADNPKDPHFREAAFVLTREGMTRSAIETYHEERQAMGRFNIAAILRSDEIAKLVRRELKRAYPNLRPDLDNLKHIIVHEVLKREVVEGDKATAAEHLMKRATRRLRKKGDSMP